MVGELGWSVDIFHSDRDGSVLVAPLTTHEWYGVRGVDLGVLSQFYPSSFALPHRLLLLRPNRLMRLLTVVDRRLTEVVLDHAMVSEPQPEEN